MAIVTATIRADSPRAETWRRVFGGLTVPLESPDSHVGDFDPADREVGRARYYTLAVGTLTLGQRARLVAHLAGRFGVPAAEVERGIDDVHGVPILADDVTVTVAARAFL